jgi:hypothetical protein
MKPALQITPEQIRERARELWERNHRPDGLDMEFWLLAERELKAERDRHSFASKPEDGNVHEACESHQSFSNVNVQ